MAIAFDAVTNSEPASTTSPLTFSHTCTGSDLILLVGITILSNGGPDITGVTYAGVPMTQAVANTTDSNEDMYIYYLLNPATGANNVSISWSGTHTVAARAVSYTGVKQSGQPDASNSGHTTAGTSLAVSVTTVADNSWIVGFARNPTGGTAGAGANTIKRNTDTTATAILEYSANPKTPAGAQTTTATNSASGRMAYLVVSIAPAPVAGGAFTPKVIFF